MARLSRRGFFWWAYSKVYDQLWDTPHLRSVCAHIDSVLPPRAPVLDVGAGTGIVTSHLIGFGRPAVGCEPNSPMASRFLRRLPGVPLARVGLAELVRPQTSHVVAVNVLHLLDDPAGGLSRLREICGPDRLVVVVTPDPEAHLLDVAAAQRRSGVTALGVARFVLWHILLAPLSMVCGVPAQVRLDWYRGVESAPCRVGDTYLMLVLPGSALRRSRIAQPPSL